MAIRKPLHIPGRRLVLTKNMILDAQSQTKSAAEASSWLNVSYNTYKKWSKYYNIFDNHKNQSGVGISKKSTNFKIDLNEIFEGKYPDYPNKVLKKRLINEGLIQEECDICKWNESRITDNKICLHLDYIDGDIKNKEYDNLRLVCSNCYFTNVGNFKNAKIFCQ